MLKLIHVSIALVAMTSVAHAHLSPSAISKAEIPVYGVYTTSDPLCQTGLVATRPLTKTAEAFDMTKGTSIATGKIPTNGINCVIIVAKLELNTAWKAGTYTSTSTFGNTSFPDSNCNAGGTNSQSSDLSGMGCGMYTDRSKTIPWPTQIKTDMDALGITYQTDCSATGSGTIFPLFLSTYSKCVGNTEDDEAIGGNCKWSTNLAVNPNDGGYRSNLMFMAPTAENDTTSGIHIDAVPAGKKKFKFIADPSISIGGDSNSNNTSCAPFGPPKFSFKHTD